MSANAVKCPSCNTVTTKGAIEWGRTKGWPLRTDAPRCPTCGHMTPGAPSEWKEPNPKPQEIYDEQVLLRYRETNEPARKVKYKLVERRTGKVLAEAQTDEQGLTERVTTEKAEHLDIFVYRLDENQNEVEKSVDSFAKTNTSPDSLRTEYIYRGRIFFDMRYKNDEKDKPQSFIKAAETQKRKAAFRGFDKYRGDIWLTFIVTTENDLKTAWQNIYDLQQKYDIEVHEGAVFTHARAGFHNVDSPGLTFAPDGEGEKLNFQEIANLPKLKWTKSSTLYLYGCNTGAFGSLVDTTSIADVFFYNQEVKTVKSQMGFSYFSYSETSYVEIADRIDDDKDIYLLTFIRRRNVMWANDHETSVMPFRTKNR